MSPNPLCMMSNDQNINILKSMKIDFSKLEPAPRMSAKELKENMKMSLAGSHDLDEINLLSEDISSPPRRTTSDKNLNDYINFESADKVPELIETVEKL